MRHRHLETEVGTAKESYTDAVGLNVEDVISLVVYPIIEAHFFSDKLRLSIFAPLESVIIVTVPYIPSCFAYFFAFTFAVAAVI